MDDHLVWIDLEMTGLDIDTCTIIDIATIVTDGDLNIIEIGPGDGKLTETIIKKMPKKLLLIEKDEELIDTLKAKFSACKNVDILNFDFLKLDIEERYHLIISNLPYNISSQILVKILRFKIWPPNFENLIFMFQKELGEKILGNFHKKSYYRKLKFEGYL